MIAKIVRNGVSTYYECRRVFVYDEVSDDPRKTGMAKIAMESDDITVEVDKSDTQVYILNDNGKTVDIYRWS